MCGDVVDMARLFYGWGPSSLWDLLWDITQHTLSTKLFAGFGDRLSFWQIEAWEQLTKDGDGWMHFLT
jgi:hypothetical protein